MATELCCNILTVYSGMVLLLLLQANGQNGCDDCKTSFGITVKIRRLTNVIMCRAVDEYVACFLHLCTDKDTLPLVQKQWLKGQIENKKFNCTIPVSLKSSTTTSDETNPTNISLPSNDRSMSTATVSTEFNVTSVMKNSQSKATLSIAELTDTPRVKTGFATSGSTTFAESLSIYLSVILLNYL